MKNQLAGLIGVVACGGNSSRMGIEKCHLNYHGKPQCYYLYELMLPFCKEVFISCNTKQSTSFLSAYNIIVDKTEYGNHGPISGLLSAFSQQQTHSILFIGCDYPYINESVIEKLVSCRNKNRSAISYVNEKMLFEPLISIYENSCLKELLRRFSEKKYSLKGLLENTDTLPIIPEKMKTIKSIDTPAEYQETMSIFKRETMSFNTHQ